MYTLASVVAYIGVAVFLIASATRVLWWLKMPIHVRWELYPVAHEPGKAHYGGSYLEETDWWAKGRHTSLVGELKAMLMEILFLVALKEHNPRLWKRSFPFHFGLYLVIGCTALMVAGGVLSALAPTALSGALGQVLRYGVIALGYGGVCLSLLGALGLLHRRLADPELKDFTAPADVFNLVFFVVAFGVALAHMLLADPQLARSMAVVQGLVTFSSLELPGTALQGYLTVGTVVLLALLVAYIPLTHMSHFIGKYFAYHAIRWNDTPNLRGGPEEAKINEVLQYPVSWAAPHIKGEGKKTWADLATEETKQ